MTRVDRSIGGDEAPDSAIGFAGWRPTPLIKLSFAAHAAGVLVVAVSPEYWIWVLAGLVLNHAVLGFTGLWPKSRWLGPNIVRLPEVRSGNGSVALTFDDGPDPDVTPRILDLLDRHGAKASFFCIGARVAAHPEIVQEIHRRGHSVENHSYRHSYAFAFYGLGRQRREVERTQDVIAKVTGRAPRFFRAPVGLRNLLLELILVRHRLRYVSWTRRGYDAVHGDSTKVLARLTQGLAAGDILLLHDSGSAKTETGKPVALKVLPALLGLLSERGFKAVSLPMAIDDDSGVMPS
jgi:peptidoglycan/xylan/chitin deacetylase (PgdA/CDA1 family)